VKKITDHLATIKILKENSVKGSDVIGAYYARRVAPLMARALPLYRRRPVHRSRGQCSPWGPSPIPRSHSASRRRWSPHGTHWGHPRLHVPGAEASPNAARCKLC
jgi:hypothetical protein